MTTGMHGEALSPVTCQRGPQLPASATHHVKVAVKLTLRLDGCLQPPLLSRRFLASAVMLQEALFRCWVLVAAGIDHWTAIRSSRRPSPRSFDHVRVLVVTPCSQVAATSKAFLARCSDANRLQCRSMAVTRRAFGGVPRS